MTDAPSYKLQFPFSLQSGYRVSDITGPVAIPVPGLTANLTPVSGEYAITVEGFPTASSAESFKAQAWLGLTTLMLDIKAAFSASTDVRHGTPVVVSNPSLPSTMQGPRVMVDEGPYVAPSGTRLIAFGMGTATVTVSTPVQRVIDSLSRGMTHPRAETLFTNARFRTAVDLFAAAHFEKTGPARLLTYVMALEVLAPSAEKHPVALALLQKWRTELTAAITAVPADSPEGSDLEALEREINFRKEASIRSRIRHLVHTTLSAVGATDAEQMARTALKAYDSRSVLLHDGSLPEQEIGVTIGNLRTILERLFQAYLTQ
jgi:hypothetical protein